MPVRVVTDSTCDLPPAVAAEHAITVVPAVINVGERSYQDGVDLSREAFYRQLPGLTRLPTTAAPAPGAFADVYRQLAAEGADAIVSIHLAGSLSGLLNSARLGAAMIEDLPIHVFDSGQLSLGLGLLALGAARAAAAGRASADILAQLEAEAGRTHVVAALESLEYVRRSGRVSWLQFGLGTLLDIKPLLQVHRGEVRLVERVRTSRRALERLGEVVAGLGPLQEAALLHIRAADKLDAFRAQAGALLPAGRPLLAVEATPVIGVHVGPGTLGVACIAAEG
ncbi:MAG: DegV family protein [Candidatus Promineifilaceae bacterium]